LILKFTLFPPQISKLTQNKCFDPACEVPYKGFGGILACFGVEKCREDAPKMAFEDNEMSENRGKKWGKNQSKNIDKNLVCIESE